MYYLEGTTVVEKTTWTDQPRLIVTKYVYPNGTGKIHMQNDGIIKEAELKAVDYNLFLKFVESPPKAEYPASGFHTPVAKGKDVTGTQFVHGPAWETTTAVYYKEDLEPFETFADAYMILAIDAGDLPSIVLSGLTKLAVDIVSRNTPTQLTVKSTPYEVFMKSDNVYYCHCYHLLCSIKNKNSNGSTSTKSARDYIQSVGG